MNQEQEKLFDMINDTNHDLEDLIETINDKEITRLIEVWEETITEEELNGCKEGCKEEGCFKEVEE